MLLRFIQNTYHASLPFCYFTIKVANNALIIRDLRKHGFVEKPLLVGQHLRNRRLILGLTQMLVAVQLDTVREVYERWERCEREPVVSVWPAIIAFLGYYPDDKVRTSRGIALMARRHTGLDQTRFAKKLGIDHARLRDWEHEIKQPDDRQINRLIEIAEAAKSTIALHGINGIVSRRVS